MSVPQHALLLAHVSDLAERAAGGEVCYTSYLTPREQIVLTRVLGKDRRDLCFDGGYPDAERRRLFLLPPWMAEAQDSLREEWLNDTKKDAIVPLRIAGSGFRTLSHKDFLGAILNLGIERDALGDLCVISPHEAILFCDHVMTRFLEESLSRVANDAVSLAEVTLPDGFDGGRRFEAVTDTVASARTDAVIAALAGVSRERASELLRRALVEIDYEVATEQDKPVDVGSVIVIRGKGKFVIRSLSDKTKKGRYRLLADKYL